MAGAPLGPDRPPPADDTPFLWRWDDEDEWRGRWAGLSFRQQWSAIAEAVGGRHGYHHLPMFEFSEERWVQFFIIPEGE